MTTLPRPVVHIIPQLRLGAGRYVVDTAIEQARQGAAVRVAIGEDAGEAWRSDPTLVGELHAAGVPVVVAGDLFHRNVRTLLAAAETLRASCLDESSGSVAHAHTAMAAAVARWAGAEVVVATCHGWSLDREPACDLQDALALASVDRVTSPSAYWARIVEQTTGVAGVAVVPVGLDLRRFPPPPPTETARGMLRIVTVAEQTARKGIADLLDAMPRVWRTRPDVELHLMGDGDARPTLEARASELDAGGRRVVFHGFVPRPYTSLHAFDLFCLPSRSDNFPVALMEAMLARLPVAATDVGGIPELVEASRCGRLTPAGNPAALAGALEDLLAMAGDERRELGRRGEAFVRRECDVAATTRRLSAVYAQAFRRAASQGMTGSA